MKKDYSSKEVVLLTEILARYDFMGLIKSGAPLDEYNVEALAFLEKISIDRNNYRDFVVISLHEICHLLSSVFNEYFGLNDLPEFKPFKQEDMLDCSLDIKAFLYMLCLGFDSCRISCIISSGMV